MRIYNLNSLKSMASDGDVPQPDNITNIYNISNFNIITYMKIKDCITK